MEGYQRDVLFHSRTKNWSEIIKTIKVGLRALVISSYCDIYMTQFCAKKWFELLLTYEL